jgi:hypothetical protein
VHRETPKNELIRHLSATSPLEITRNYSGINFRLDYEYSFPAKITGGSQPYSWKEVVPTTGGTWNVPTSTRSGTTSVNEAWEMTGNTKVPAGTFVRMVKGFFNYGSSGQEYVFESQVGNTGSGGGGTGGQAVGMGAQVQNAGGVLTGQLNTLAWGPMQEAP